MDPLPYEVIEAMIQCFGRSFHYKDPMASFLLANGAKRALVDKYRTEPKFVWGRRVLAELGESEEGIVAQRRILGALYKLRDLPDPEVQDRNAGLDALRHLKALVLQHNLIAEEAKGQTQQRTATARTQSQLVRERAAKLEALRNTFNQALVSDNRQEAGYSLEDLLADLFSLFEFEYRKPYRTGTQQIDGHFSFHGFDYLVEAKWRKDQPTEGEIGGFQRKVKTKLESTRGLFVSVAGFRQEVVEQFSGQGANIILMDGEHLVHILEGRIDLREALRKMIETAAQRGIVYTRLL